MPLIVIFIGVLLVAAGINNKIPELTGLLKEDFKPSGSQPGFQVWILAIVIVGAIGYVRQFKPVANAFLVLIVVGMLLSNGGFFAKFNDAIEGKT